MPIWTKVDPIQIFRGEIWGKLEKNSSTLENMVGKGNIQEL